MNECLVIAPFTGDSLLNASLSLLSSKSLTKKKNTERQIKIDLPFIFFKSQHGKIQ